MPPSNSPTFGPATVERDRTAWLDTAFSDRGLVKRATGGRGVRISCGTVVLAARTAGKIRTQLVDFGADPFVSPGHHHGRDSALRGAAGAMRKHPSVAVINLRHQVAHAMRYWLPESVDAILLLRRRL